MYTGGAARTQMEIKRLRIENKVKMNMKLESNYLKLYFTISKCIIILVWATSWTPVVGGLIVCVNLSEDMSPYCSAHYEWLIMKLCMHVGYHDANNVSNFGGDPVTQLN